MGKSHPGFLTMSSKVFWGENNTPKTRLIALIWGCGSGAAGETAVVVAIGKSSTTRLQALYQNIRRDHSKDFEARILARTSQHCKPFGVRQLCFRFSRQVEHLGAGRRGDRMRRKLFISNTYKKWGARSA
jgi:hypothetical protein